MPRFPKARKRPDNTPTFLAVARSFYGEAFGSRRKTDIAEAMADWSELTEDEQSFALAHMHYLDLVAQSGTQRLLVQVRDLLEEIAEGFEVGEDDDEVEDGLVEESEVAGLDEPLSLDDPAASVELSELDDQGEVELSDDDAEESEEEDDVPEGGGL